MEVVLVGSANNYAESLASWAFGSESAFLDAARTWLDANGLTSTTLFDSSGMNPGNTSTASDLVELGKIALANPVVAAVVGTKTVTLPYVGKVENTNELLGIDGIEGIKTGTLDEAGACLLFAASITVGDDDIDVVGVILGGTDHSSLNAAVQALLASAIAGFRELSLVKSGDVSYTFSTPWGQSAKAVDRVGTVTFTTAGKTITVPIMLDAELSDPGPWWRLTNPLGLIR